MIWFLVLAMAILTGALVTEYTPNKNTKAELMALQAQYLKTREQGVLSEMWTRLNAMAQGHVRNWMRKARRSLSTPDVEAKAADAANYLVEQYLTRPDFRITDSFDSYLRLRVMAELASPKRRLRDRSEIHLDSEELHELPSAMPGVLEQTGCYQQAILDDLWDYAVEITDQEFDPACYRRLIQLWLSGWSKQELREESVSMRLDYARHIEHRKAILEYVRDRHKEQLPAP